MGEVTEAWVCLAVAYICVRFPPLCERNLTGGGFLLSESGRERTGLAEIFRQDAAVPLPAMLNRIYRVGRYTVMKKIF